MSNERSSLLDEMRQGREESSTAFMEFANKRAYYQDYAFCFYEGEDGKYYDSRIRGIIGQKFMHIKAGNKKKVLQVMKMIKKKMEYREVNTMFFVDRDMSFNMPEYQECDLYVTPCYSIENLYVSESSFGLILETEFGLNIDESDYKKYIKRFAKLYCAYCELMVEFNALILICKEKYLDCGKVNIQSIKSTDIINIDIVSGVAKSPKYNEKIEELKRKLNVSDEDVESAKNRLLSYGDKRHIFRGKNQFDFMTKFIEQLCNRKYELFNPVPTSININPNQNRLSTYSIYAQTPECLETFLQAHKKRVAVKC